MVYSVTSVNRILTKPTRSPAVSFLYDREGRRKYLTIQERRLFLKAAAEMPDEDRVFALVLAYSGGRISEVLALCPGRLDPSAHLLVFESLKKRRRGVFRAVPLPAFVFHELASILPPTSAPDTPIWPWKRTTAWKRVRRIMHRAGIKGPQASPKGLRHSFAVTSLQAGVPITLIKRWLGHSRLSTTETYAEAIGPEEEVIAAKFWKSF
jgi:integrase/recombinase XerD